VIQPSPEMLPGRPKWDDFPLTLLENTPLGPHHLLRLEAPGLAGRFSPGQFLNISVPGHVLRRPLAVLRQDQPYLELVVTPFGLGTQKLVTLPAGTRLHALGPLGNSFPLPPDGDIALVSAGAGVAALMLLAEQALAQNRRVHVFHGAPGSEDVQLVQTTYERLGLVVDYYSEDGSHGSSGLPTDGLGRLLESGAPLTVYSVGPYALMKAAALLALSHGRPAYVSLDVHMACGVGACLSCAVMTASGQKHACVDGPIFAAEEVVW
jgi:dihydroorotate dehydrogenase electron transfer subunit